MILLRLLYSGYPTPRISLSKRREATRDFLVEKEKKRRRLSDCGEIAACEKKKQKLYLNSDLLFYMKELRSIFESWIHCSLRFVVEHAFTSFYGELFYLITLRSFTFRKERQYKFPIIRRSSFSRYQRCLTTRDVSPLLCTREAECLVRLFILNWRASRFSISNFLPPLQVFCHTYAYRVIMHHLSLFLFSCTNTWTSCCCFQVVSLLCRLASLSSLFPLIIC